MDYFRKGLNFSGLWDEEDVILESFSWHERVHMVPSDDSDDDFFYMYLPVIQDLGVLIPFTMFERCSKPGTNHFAPDIGPVAQGPLSSLLLQAQV